MSDYERYGEYNIDDDEERGPERSRLWIWLLRLLRIAAACLLAGVCLVIAFRMIFSSYYPKEMKRIHYTDSLAAYVVGRDIYAETQNIRVPFGDELLFGSDDGRLVQSESRFGFYYADNLIVVREGGSLQLSIRINKNDIKNIAAKYELTDFAFSEDAFAFILFDNRNLAEDKEVAGNDKNYILEMGTGGVYTPTYVKTDSAMMYHYIKICFDNVDFGEDVKWMRLDITPRGVDTEAEGYKQLGICVYENNDDNSYFKEYKLKKSEKLS